MTFIPHRREKMKHKEPMNESCSANQIILPCIIHVTTWQLQPFSTMNILS